MNNNSLTDSLISADDSVLVVIDAQKHFINKLSKKKGRRLVNRIGWLVELSKMLDIPLIVTAEDTPKLGGISSTISKKLPPGLKIYNKMSFGLTDQNNIIKAIKSFNRKTMILVGMETDVCIAHSAIGLLRMEYKVVVISDATGSQGKAHEAGIERIKNAGGTVLPLKSNDIISRLGAPDAIKL